MISIAFEGLGTHWQILIDQKGVSDGLLKSIEKMVARFEQKYSRFLSESEVSLVGISKKRRLIISADLANMLRYGLELNKLTDGVFDLNVAAILESYGYDSDYSFIERGLHTSLGDFSLSGTTLTKRGKVKIDLGALGKGYLVDLIVEFIQRADLAHFLVNGGGDIYATSKADGQPWSVAIEHPLYSDCAIGVVKLKNQALATSSPQKRKYGSFHHLLNFQTRKPIKTILSVSVLAKSAMAADGAATAMFISADFTRLKMAKELGLEYLVIYPNLTQERSPNFPEIFQDIT